MQSDKFYLIEGHVIMRLRVLTMALILKIETQEPMTQMELLDTLRHIGDLIPTKLPEAF